MMLKRTIFVLAMFFLPVTVNAGDIDGIYAGQHTNGEMPSCGQYVVARDEGRRGDYINQNVFISWVAGYITAYNRQTPDTYSIRGQTDLSAMLLWLENYCKEKPLGTFAYAMALLTNKLHPKRIRRAPK